MSASAAPSSAPFLEETAFIDYNHPRIQATVAEVTRGATDDREKAVRIHDFVRDEIQFGWASAFYDQTASAALESGIGFCNTKSTLFVAMLRAAEIPARQHFVSINAQIISDFLAPGTPYVDHSFTEVFLDGRWIATDSYIVDLPLFTAAQARLTREGRLLGYGVHGQGSPHWDGRSPAFAQFLNNGSFARLTNADHGVYADVEAFYASGQGVNTLGFISRLFFRLAIGNANRAIDELRHQKEPREA